VPITELLAFPGYLLFDGERCVAEGVTELFGWLLLALADLSAVDHHVVFIGNAIDPDGTEGILSEAHSHLRRYYTYGMVL
jgi:hypothetical protein